MRKNILLALLLFVSGCGDTTTGTNNTAVSTNVPKVAEKLTVNMQETNFMSFGNYSTVVSGVMPVAQITNMTLSVEQIIFVETFIKPPFINEMPIVYPPPTPALPTNFVSFILGYNSQDANGNISAPVEFRAVKFKISPETTPTYSQKLYLLTPDAGVYRVKAKSVGILANYSSSINFSVNPGGLL